MTFLALEGLRVTPSVDPAVMAIAPTFRGVNVFVDTHGSLPLLQDTSALAEACHLVGGGEPSWAEAHLGSWAETYVRFGAKPTRTPCSAQALRKRVLRDGILPSIDPVVDLYNAVSLRFAVPVGGENIAAYEGRPRLTVADGTETFDTIANGQPMFERAAAGEVIWRDDVGVTCRRWNWRQGIRTRLDSRSRRMWFVLESLDTMPVDALEEAGTLLENGLRALYPDCDLWRGVLPAP